MAPEPDIVASAMGHERHGGAEAAVTEYGNPHDEALVGERNPRMLPR